MKYFKRLLGGALCAAVGMSAVGVSLTGTPLSAKAAVSENNVLNEDFSGDLDDNWVVNGSGGDLTAAINPEDGVLKLRSAATGNRSYVYLDGTDVSVPDNGSLVVEYDLVSLANINASGAEETVNWANFFGLLKGIKKDGAAVPAEITPLQMSDTIVHTNPGFSKHAMATPAGRSMKIAVNEARPDFFGTTEAAVVRVQSMDSLLYYSDDPACLFRNAEGSPVYATGDKGNVVSTPLESMRLVYTFNKDGSAKLEERAVGAAASANEVKYTFPAGTFTQLDGMIGFYLEREGGTETQLTIDNLSIKTKAGDTVTEVYSSDFSTGAGESWKASSAGSKISNPPSLLTFDNSPQTHYLVSAPYTSVTADFLAGRYYARYDTSLKIDALAEREIGLLFGLDVDDDGAETTGVYTLAISRRGGGTYLLSLYQGNGTGKAAVGTPVELTADFKDFTDISVFALCNKTVEVKIGAQTVTFGSASDPVVFDKRFGLIALGETGTGAAAKFSFKNFRVDALQSYASEGKDLYMNFDGKDAAGNPWYNEEDYFIRSGKAGVSSNEGVFLRDGKLVFDNAGDTSAFIPQYRYTDFEMLFDLEDLCRKPEKDASTGKITRPVTNKFFICYNGQSKQFLYAANNLLEIVNPIDKEWSADAEEYKSAVADTSEMSIVKAGGLKTVSGGDFRHNLLDQKYAGKTFRFRIVVHGKTLSLYYSLLGEEDYDSNLYSNPVYVGKSENSFDGYVAISNTSFPDKMSASLTIDNFILRNTDSMINFPTEDQPKAASSVTLDKASLVLKAGDTATLAAQGEGTLSWKSSDEKVAKVDENGKITAVGEGTATITVSSGDASAVCVVVVTGAENSEEGGCGSSLGLIGGTASLSLVLLAAGVLLSVKAKKRREL